METLLSLTLLVLISLSCVLSQSYPSGTTPIKGSGSAVSASYNLYESVIEKSCIDPIQGQRSYPTGQSMENLIALIEKLENRLTNITDGNLANQRGAEKVARLLLRRFRFDGFDGSIGGLPYKRQRDINIDLINTAFLGIPEQNQNNYYFPDYVYTSDELCSLFFMFSHNIVNTTDNSRGKSYAPNVFRGKRQANQYNRRQYNPIGQDNAQQPQQPVVSGFLVNRNIVNPFKEEGVVSFRGSKSEAIAPARVLIGVIAGLTQDIKTQTGDVLKAIGVQNFESTYDKPIDPVLAITLADLWGSGSERLNQNPADDKSLYYGLSGEWASTTCTTYYGLSVTPDKFDSAVKTSKGTKAEIRGGIDGYLIGKSLKSIRIDDPLKLRLSTVLRSYYSRPKTSKSSSLTVSYCDRNTQSNFQDLQNTAQNYNTIYTLKSLGTPSGLLNEFNPALSLAQAVESNGFNQYCNRPGGTLDKTAPCETPSDVLFIIDGQTSERLQVSGDIVSSVLGNLNNIRTEGGSVSIFFNSQGRNTVNPNIQPQGEWPLVPAAFNSTNTGCSSCRINDFNTSLPQSVPNTGKLFLYLNQTLFNYESWGGRTNFSAIPAKTAVLIDLGPPGVVVAPESGQDRSDYNYYKDQLRYRHRDVRYLSVASNQELFKDILREDTDKETPGAVGSPNLNIGPTFAKKICENPATFQYNDCYRKKSENIQYVGYVTPGYKQNWAMYPEFFLKSFNIKFTFKPEDGDIKVCFDRKFPPERTEIYYCEEVKSGAEKVFEISNPCKGRSFENCDPFYFTVWGKDRTVATQCLDEKCASLDQIKFTVTHSGVQCSSSNHLLPSNTFQVILLFISAIFYLFLTNNKS